LVEQSDQRDGVGDAEGDRSVLDTSSIELGMTNESVAEETRSSSSGGEDEELSVTIMSGTSCKTGALSALEIVRPSLTLRTAL
jgi:hypothetical protein